MCSVNVYQLSVCFVLWLKCRHTLTVKQQDQLQEWCGCGVSRPALTYMLTNGLIPMTGQFGRVIPRGFKAQMELQGPGHTPGAARGRPTCLVSQRWWPTHPQLPPRGQPAPAPPFVPLLSHLRHQNKWKRLLGSWVNITILARQIYISEVYFR
ncbi:hypothetical protein Hamer_G016210 [Homarus americanus]|uniref:Uncharacterized protein n=1 Tax=Homarus americanus TaxID=6706 RepID=A0A8J5K4D3_HOMAM|nr:hypothetical protein Hamer_G016210 [Homarus americanus]